jgi:hypothetical protein
MWLLFFPGAFKDFFLRAKGQQSKIKIKLGGFGDGNDTGGISRASLCQSVSLISPDVAKGNPVKIM